MPYFTKINYFDVDDGTEIEKKEIRKKKYIKVKTITNQEFNKHTGWTTITKIVECKKNPQLTIW